MLLPRNDILVKYNKNSEDDAHYYITNRFDNFYFEELILLQNISKITDNFGNDLSNTNTEMKNLLLDLIHLYHRCHLYNLKFLLSFQHFVVIQHN